METLTDTLTKLPRVERGYTPEELEIARRKMAEKLARDLGMCSADCPECGGVGYVRNEIGGVVLCSQVDRWKLPSASRIGISKEEYETLSWDDVVPTNNSIAEAGAAIQKVMAWGFGWVFLHGGFGIGKTLMLKIAVADALCNRKESAYVRLTEILDHLRETFDDGVKETESARLDWWSSLPILCIDEFDKLRSTPYGSERQFVLMDRRYDQAIRRESVTIISSNEPPGKLPGYLADRVQDGRFFVVKLDGKSMRPGMTWEGDNNG